MCTPSVVGLSALGLQQPGRILTAYAIYTPSDGSSPAYVSKFYRFKDEQGIYRLHEIIRTASMGPRPNLSYEYKGYTPEWGWRQIRPKIEALDKAGRLTWSKTGRPYLKRYLHEQGGTPISSMVIDLPPISGQSSERVGYPTQKPLKLYDRIIQASSNEGDMVLDPFCGCATTCVAAELAHRKWVGIDIWAKAHEVVLDRFRKEGFTAKGHSGGRLSFGKVHYATEPPKRTDDGAVAAPHLRVRERVFEPPGPKMSRAAMYKYLLGQHGIKCQGCNRTFDDPRYLQLDHNTPRSSGGINHISNRILLCGPCNRLKSNVYTLIGLKRKNTKLGYMAGSVDEHPIMKEIRKKKEKSPPLFE